MNVASRTSAASRGFGLVELMVGLVVGLIGIIVVFQTFAVAEGYKRTTTSGADAQQSGSVALFYIERDLRMAGYGINQPGMFGCTVLAHDATAPARDFSFAMTPVIITDGASGAPDTITVTYGTSDLLPAPADLIQTMTAPDSTFRVGTRYGFVPGDVVIASEPGKNCSMAQVTALPTTAGQTDNVNHTTGNYLDASGSTAVARYNKAGGLGVTYAAFDYSVGTGGRLYNLGRAPVNNVYSVASGQLLLTDLLQSTAGTALADHVVQLQAQYGKDNVGNDGIVDTWEATMPATPTADDWSRVLAVRLAVVARSGLRERPNALTGACTTTTANPTWSGGTLDITGLADWQCYRYRVFETTVPLRNMIWRPA